MLSSSEKSGEIELHNSNILDSLHLGIASQQEMTTHFLLTVEAENTGIEYNLEEDEFVISEMRTKYGI